MEGTYWPRLPFWTPHKWLGSARNICMSDLKGMKSLLWARKTLTHICSPGDQFFPPLRVECHVERDLCKSARQF